MVHRIVGNYEILGTLGQGGMGLVYKARDLRLERFVALKVLSAGKSAEEDSRRRFLNEAKAASALNHPNIVTVHDIFDYEGETFIVMELVVGKSLTQLIPRTGMRVPDALRIAAQTADALAAAHSVGLVHRDLKPGNIMVDHRGQVKVLDFGLAKMFAALTSSANQDDTTRTMVLERPLTDEGTILGTVPYMSPEQVEGRLVDARSDIFSFGAVLFEMITGQRAFDGQSRASTLAAVVERDPPPLSDLVAGSSPELDRLIARCLKKDVTRRWQTMTDLRLTLEELRDESESGNSHSSSQIQKARPKRRFWWLATALLLFVSVATIAWSLRNRTAIRAYPSSELLRVSPDDGFSYFAPSISDDGKFVAYVADRSGDRQVWVQQVQGGAPIQVTHSAEPVMGGLFLPGATNLLYVVNSADGTSSTISVIPFLGGEPRILLRVPRALGGALSQDGQTAAYFERDITQQTPRVRLIMRPLSGGTPKELTSWNEVQPTQIFRLGAVWTSDGRYVLCVGSKHPASANFDEWEWYALPRDGGAPRATGAGDMLRAAGFQLTNPTVVYRDRVFFSGGKQQQNSIWEVRLAPDTARVVSGPRQVTLGGENQMPFTVSATGLLALNIYKESANAYLVPVSPDTGQPIGPTRRITHDGRMKLRLAMGGKLGNLYFRTGGPSGAAVAVDLATGTQTSVPGISDGASAVSVDGKRVAYTVPDGPSASIRIGDTESAPVDSRQLCSRCGSALRFSADGRYIFVSPEAANRAEPRHKRTVRLLDVNTGNLTPWLEHPTDSIVAIGTFGRAMNFVVFTARSPQGTSQVFGVPWKVGPIPVSEWMNFSIPATENWNYAPAGNFIQLFFKNRLMTAHFDANTRSLGDPFELKFAQGSDPLPKADDEWLIRGPGTVFWRRETTGSVWVLKLPE